MEYDRPSRSTASSHLVGSRGRDRASTEPQRMAHPLLQPERPSMQAKTGPAGAHDALDARHQALGNQATQWLLRTSKPKAVVNQSGNIYEQKSHPKAQPLTDASRREEQARSPELQFLDQRELAGQRARVIPSGIRTAMAASFGRSFSEVRLHTGPKIDQTAELLGASAFTIGADIYLHSRVPDPDRDPGRVLLAEELAHVAQGVGTRTVERVTSPNEPMERQAKQAALAAVAGERPAVTVSMQARSAVACQKGTQAKASADPFSAQKKRTAQIDLWNRRVVNPLQEAKAAVSGVPPDARSAAAKTSQAQLAVIEMYNPLDLNETTRSHITGIRYVMNNIVDLVTIAVDPTYHALTVAFESALERVAVPPAQSLEKEEDDAEKRLETRSDLWNRYVTPPIIEAWRLALHSSPPDYQGALRNIMKADTEVKMLTAAFGIQGDYLSSRLDRVAAFLMAAIGGIAEMLRWIDAALAATDPSWIFGSPIPGYRKR